MVLKDFACGKCGAIKEFTVSPDTSTLGAHCSTCDFYRSWISLCNGGLKSRWRHADWPSDPAFYRDGLVTSSPPEADDGATGLPLEHKDGGYMQNQKKFQPDGRAERRDVIHRETDRKRGTTPIMFDQGK